MPRCCAATLLLSDWRCEYPCRPCDGRRPHIGAAPVLPRGYPKKAPQEAHAVLLLAEPWPSVLARGRSASQRAEACCVPIAKGLTRHGLRHAHSTIMEELRTPPKLMDERMGHLDGSVSARYSHVTRGMRKRLLAGLTELWEASLEARRAMCPRSPVAVLDRLLRT